MILATSKGCSTMVLLFLLIKVLHVSIYLFSTISWEISRKPLLTIRCLSFCRSRNITWLIPKQEINNLSRLKEMK